MPLGYLDKGFFNNSSNSKEGLNKKAFRVLFLHSSAFRGNAEEAKDERKHVRVFTFRYRLLPVYVNWYKKVPHLLYIFLLFPRWENMCVGEGRIEITCVIILKKVCIHTEPEKRKKRNYDFCYAVFFSAYTFSLFSCDDKWKWNAVKKRAVQARAVYYENVNTIYI